LSGQHIEVQGKLNIAERDTLSTGDNVVVFEADGTLAEMNLNDVIVRYFLELPNGVQTLLNAGETIETLLNRSDPIYLYEAGVLTDSLYGNTYAGGLIFNLDTLDIYPFDGLVAAHSDQHPSEQWFNGTYMTTNAIGTAIGTGQSNTDSIVTYQGIGYYAAYICDTLTLNGYDDWFLPSKDELNLIYQNLYLNGFGDFFNNLFWSSSENESNIGYAWRQNFLNGSQNLYDKGHLLSVRATRKF
jgi:hypothetical protein